MARLPTRTELSAQGSLRSGRTIASYDVSGIGRGISAIGGALQEIGAERKKQQNVVDVNRAEAMKTEGLLAAQNEFANDGDYSTFRQRAPQKTKGIVDQAASVIRDPVMRERWQGGARLDEIRANDAIYDRGDALRSQAEIASLDEGLEINRRIYVDPNTPEDVRAKARGEIIGAIDVAEEAGVLTPAQAAAHRRTFVEDADVSRGRLAVNADPNVIGEADAAALLRRFEGFRETPYWDVNAHRIGYGSDTITRADGSVVKVEPGMRVTRADAERDLARRAGEFANHAAGQVGVDNWAALPDAARAALTSVAYNYGSLPGSVVAAVKSGDTEAIAKAVEGLAGYNDGVNARRRQQEAAVIRGGGQPDWWDRLSPEQQFALRKEADTVRNQRNVELRSQIEIVAANAPVAILNTGGYENQLPTADQFMAAYGPQEGAERFNRFMASVDTAEQAFDMRTMSASEIEAMVDQARPTSAGDNAALETERYNTLSRAAEATLKARNADPVAYTMQAFPAVQQAWANAATSPGGVQAAIAATVTAQQQLGMRDIRALPKEQADLAVKAFGDESLPQANRLGAISSMLFATSDPAQRQAVFQQLVDAGLPAETEGVFEALARGDEGAANRLFLAATIDPAKLPGQAPEKPAAIDEAIQSSLMDEGQIGDVAYGLTDGTVENFEKAQRDAKLLNNAVNLRLRRGETMDAAIAGAARDLYGDVQPVSTDRARLMLPAGEDPTPVLERLEGSLPKVREALASRMAVEGDVPTADGSRAILDAATQNYVDSVVEQGYFRNASGGYVFIDPMTGTAVPGADGNPLVFTDADLQSTAPAPTWSLDEDAADELKRIEERARTSGQFMWDGQ